MDEMPEFVPSWIPTRDAVRSVERFGFWECEGVGNVGIDGSRAWQGGEQKRARACGGWRMGTLGEDLSADILGVEDIKVQDCSE